MNDLKWVKPTNTSWHYQFGATEHKIYIVAKIQTGPEWDRFEWESYSLEGDLLEKGTEGSLALAMDEAQRSVRHQRITVSMIPDAQQIAKTSLQFYLDCPNGKKLLAALPEGLHEVFRDLLYGACLSGAYDGMRAGKDALRASHVREIKARAAALDPQSEHFAEWIAKMWE